MAPVTGMIRKRLYKDIALGLGLGYLGGYYFWYAVHLPMMKKRDDYYIKLEAQKA